MNNIISLSVKKPCILEYVKIKIKANFQIFFIWHRKLQQYVNYYQK